MPEMRKQKGKGRKLDERARRTRERLGLALLALVQETSYDGITVQQVLQRARVGRSTFYLHYRDKNDLLLSQLEKFLEIMSTALSAHKEKSSRVVPIAEMFAHIAAQMPLYRSLKRADRLNDFFELAQIYFARGIAQRLAESGRLSNCPKPELEARAEALAGSLLALLRWWLDRSMKLPPQAMDDMFHQMVWKGVG
jgi:AcrR family transcriptional regulator